jgi:hypothetical protein
VDVSVVLTKSILNRSKKLPFPAVGEVQDGVQSTQQNLDSRY